MSRPPAKAYSYLRFSTPEQSKGDSLRRQIALADDYAKRHGLTLDAELNLKDLGISAYRGANRAVGALGGFLKAVTDGLVEQGSYLLVESLDRVSRQTARKAVRTLEDIVEAGVTVVTLTDGKAYTAESLDGTDFLWAILLFMRGNEESLMKSKRVKATWVKKRQRAAAGEIQTIRAPGWLRAEGSGAKESRNARFTVIPERAALVRRMYDMFFAGHGKKGISEAFNREGIPPWGRARFWYSTYVFKCLTSPAVLGFYTPTIYEHPDGRVHRVKQEPIAGYFPAIIDEETFQRAQTLIKGRTNPVRKGHIASLLAGLAKCPRCGATMTRVIKGGKRKHPPSLVCVKAKAGAGCSFRSAKLPDIEQAFAENVSHFRAPPLAEADLATEIEGTENALYEVRKEIRQLVRAIKMRASEALSKELAELEAHAEKVKADLEALRLRAAATESRVVALRSKRVADAIGGPVAVTNAALREALESVTVDYDEGVLKLKWRHGPLTEIRYGPGRWGTIAA